VVDTEGLLLPSMVTAALGSRPKRYLATVFSAEGYFFLPPQIKCFVCPQKPIKGVVGHCLSRNPKVIIIWKNVHKCTKKRDWLKVLISCLTLLAAMRVYAMHSGWTLQKCQMWQSVLCKMLVNPSPYYLPTVFDLCVVIEWDEDLTAS
jgi:hypothetical protein